MPASELGWSTPPKAPFFVDIYKTKRKAPSDQSSEQQLNLFACTQDEDVPAAKRKCSWTWGGRNESQLQSAMEINHNNMHCHEDILRQQDRHLQSWCCGGASAGSQVVRVPSPWPAGNVPAPPVAAGSTVPEGSMGDHVMDLNGETYNEQATMIAETEAACLSMDTDYTPDPSQYDTRPATTDNPPVCTKTWGYCGSGKPSPTSGRVRCYCKPSWEGMLDMRPYISDIY
ncbi:hypothetical protein NP493_1218g00047 [Ridgeia piscesae]|uniref:Uncharacterized protein n=1 Tax=Ridgeia piscesae TaxID=27915 RepID=A0AAD9KBR5_RIDPI|nr:hypothetical protein NP493_1218g00047 [Ridgeia piscesae]